MLGRPYDWSLSNLAPDDPHRDAEKVARIHDTLLGEGIYEAYATNVQQFNGKCVSPQRLNIPVPLGEKVTLFTDKALYAEGTYLVPGEKRAVLFSPAGCAIALAAYHDTVIVVHVGWESVQNGLCEDIVHSLNPREHDVGQVQMHIIGAIRPENYEGRDLVGMFVQRAKQVGIDERNINLPDAYLPEGFWHTRDGVGGNKKRNLVVVY